MEKITVIVPVYNTRPYLSRCVESILHQSWEHLQILLIDDGSTDGSGAMCDDLAKSDPRIRVIHQPNQGLSAARNAGLDAAEGEYLCFVDSDDRIYPEMLTHLHRAMSASGAEMALCNIRRIPGGDTPMKGEILTRGEFVEKLLKPQAWYYITATNKLYRKALFRDLRFPEGRIHEDEAVIYPLAARVSRVAVVEDCLYDYIRRADSIMASAGEKGTADKLYALSTRLPLCREMGWHRAWEANCSRFAHLFLEDYTGQEAMGDSLSRAIPHVLLAKSVPVRQKGYLICIRIFPRLFLCLRRMKRRLFP